MERILALMSKNYKCVNKTIVGITYNNIKFQFQRVNKWGESNNNELHM